jgi:Xaa-Pro aminopeptidase
MNIIKEKIDQAIGILNELDIDLWLTFCRESDSTPDPVSNLIVGSGACWLSGYFIDKSGDTTVLVGQADAPDFERSDLYKHVVTYSEDVGKALVDIISAYNPGSIALNYSESNYTADGLSHGLFLMLQGFLGDTPYADRLISSEEIITRVRGRKTSAEIVRIEKAAGLAAACWERSLEKIETGMSEKEIAAVFLDNIHSQGNTPSFNPIVNAGSKTKPGHGSPTDERLAPGDLLHVDFGVKYKGYCSDIQRLAFFKKEQESVPASLTSAFKTVSSLLHQSIAMYKPGAMGHEIDAFVRRELTQAGYPEYNHGLGHQIGQAVHDGSAIVGPLWPRYGNLGAIPLEAGNTFTAEFGVSLEGIGHVSLEEDVVVTPEGGRILCTPQTDLVVINSSDQSSWDVKT